MKCAACGADGGDIGLCQSCAVKVVERLRAEELTCAACGASTPVNAPRVRRGRTTYEATARLCWVCARLYHSAQLVEGERLQ